MISWTHGHWHLVCWHPVLTYSFQGTPSGSRTSYFSLVFLLVETFSHGLLQGAQLLLRQTPKPLEEQAPGGRATANGLVGLIGNTLLVRINSLSAATGCEARQMQLISIAVISGT